MWIFRDFVSQGGRNYVADWYKERPAQVRADFDALLRILERTKEWKKSDFKRLQGKKYKGLGEIRWQTKNVQYRVICCAGSDSREHVLLIGCTHKGSVYDPPSAFDTALQRMKLLRSGEGGTREHGNQTDYETSR